MNFKILVHRGAALTFDAGTGVTPMHPAAGLSCLSYADTNLPQPAAVGLLYGKLAALGFPQTANVGIPSPLVPQGGGIIGPDGYIPFQIGRVVHRIAWGSATYLDPGVIPVLGGPMFKADGLNPSDNLVKVGPNITITDGLQLNSNPYREAMESNAFVDIQGNFSNVPSNVKQSRITTPSFTSLGYVTTDIETSIDTLAPAKSLTQNWMGRNLGTHQEPINRKFYEGKVAGGIGASCGQFISIIDCTVDDNFISQALSQTGKAYLVWNAGMTKMNFNMLLDPSDSIMWNDGSGEASNKNVLCIDITTLSGTGFIIEEHVDLINGPLPGAFGSIEAAYQNRFRLGAAVVNTDYDSLF